MTDIQARFATLEADARAAQGHKVYGELVIDGKTLSHVLGVGAIYLVLTSNQLSLSCG